MLEILQDFEKTATQFSPVVLTGPGLAAVLVGLFIWLGGLGFRRLLVAVVGAVTGGICGFLIAGRNIRVVIITAGAAAVVAIIFERLFVATLAAALAAVVVFAVMAGLYTENFEEATSMNRSRPTAQSSTFSTQESIEKVRSYMADVGENIKQTCSQMPVHSWPILMALVLIFVVAGFFLRRLASALCYSTLGTMLIFAGMILLLLYKGSLPISSIYSRAPFYGAVFAAMTGFGTIEQLVLCQRAKRESTKRTRADKGKEGSRETTQD